MIGGNKVKKTIILCLIIICVSIVLGKVFNNWLLTVKICGSIGLVCFGTAIILNDKFVSADKYCANNSTYKENIILRGKITNFVMILGATNIILAAVIFL